MIKPNNNLNLLEKEVKEVIAFGKKNNLKICFSIGNTSKKENLDFYQTPIRKTNLFIATGAVVFTENAAIKILNILNKYKFDYVFVDSEKKIPNPKKKFEVSNLERVVKEHSLARVLTYKANDITIDSANALLNIIFSDYVNSVGGKKIGIIGLGNIGSKLSLKLVEQGASIFVLRRNKKYQNLIIKMINSIKPKFTESYVRSLNNNNFKDLDVLIASTNGKKVINQEIVNKLKKYSTIIDIGKNNLAVGVLKKCFQKKINVYRLDITSAYISAISGLIYADEILKSSFGRKKINTNFFVSGGMIGQNGDIVVDNINNIRKIYGIADGSGDFIRKINNKQKKIINNLKKYYDKIS